MTTDFNFPAFDLTTARPVAQHPKYIIDPALYNAVQVAILLQQPLLLTGEPGTGKTRLAEELALRLSRQADASFLSQPLVFHTKTTSTFTDLFYTYDALGHFHAAHFDGGNQTPKSGPLKPIRQQSLDTDGPVIGKLSSPSQPDGSPQASSFVQLQALGQAILLSNATALSEYNQRVGAYLPMNNVLIDRPRSSVVLIDEVDKAPRDFANDLLNELDRFEFCVREDRNRTYCKGEGKVIVILTSNSEKNLPDAFLRRCIFYHIEFPNEEQLLAIVRGQLFTAADEEQPANQQREDHINARLKEYIGVFTNIRKENPKKPPATAELISWIFFLRKYVLGNVPYNAIDKDVRRAGNSILAKHKDDLLALNAPLTT